MQIFTIIGIASRLTKLNLSLVNPNLKGNIEIVEYLYFC